MCFAQGRVGQRERGGVCVCAADPRNSTKASLIINRTFAMLSNPVGLATQARDDTSGKREELDGSETDE